jgi:acyl-CoA synthetase (AMP-forming)/AMP-acid ligase II/3-oxoacyl-(acyl-carrier-protein) synthase/thioesterase domain-containing protein/acyl carrier protein
VNAIAAWGAEHARRFGREIALIEGERSCTNRELYERACRLAGALLALGIRAGDRVAISLPNCADFYAAAWAVFHGGMVLVVVTGASEEETVRMLQHCGARALIGTGELAAACLARVEGLLALCPQEHRDGRAGVLGLSTLIDAHPPLEAAVPRLMSDPAQLCYTSGSSGSPKAVIYTQHGIDRFLRARAAAMPPPPGQLHTVLVAVPPTAFGAGFVSMRVLGNQRYVLLERFEAEAVLAAIERYRIESMPLLPTMVEQLLAHPNAGQRDCSSLRAINISGAHVPAALVTRVRALLGGPRVVVHYGMTETGGGIASSETGVSSGGGNVGRVVEGTQVRIVDAGGNDVKPGEIGEIIARTPYVAAGYWNDPKRTAAVFRDGFVWTGDLGRFNPAGELCVLGRSKDVIVQGGCKILPLDLVKVIEQLAGVAECAVVGVEDELMGEEAVACLTCQPGAVLTEREVIDHCANALDPRKTPGQVLFFEQLPRTPVGKVDRAALKNAVLHCREAACQPRLVLSGLARGQREQYVADVIERALRESVRDPARIPLPLPSEAVFGELGLDSLGAVRLTHRLREHFPVRLAATAVYANPSLRQLVSHILSKLSPDGSAGAAAPASPISTAREPVSIIGLGCRVPGANGPEELWRLLESATDAIGEAPASRWPQTRNPWLGGFLRDAAHFDADFFRLDGCAEQIDPRHRIMMEVAWEALENAGLDPLELPAERTGVFLGISGERYVSPDPLGCAPGMSVGYLCQFLDLRGPVISIDTTCSSSLAAVHTAITSLRGGECDVAIAGGVSLLSKPAEGAALGLVSPDGRSRSFDADANGFGPGEGCVMLILKRHADAKAAPDRIYANLVGSAINHDGRSSSLTAPNPRSQATLIRSALRVAGIEPEAVQYVEAHGTATPLGDPIEVEALADVFGNRAAPALRIGSIKSNIGHLEAAAGAAGVAKVALAIHYAHLPASLHCVRPNPRVAWADIPVRVQSSASDWPSPSDTRIAGVSSFGLSGTNAHVIVAQSPAEPSHEMDAPGLQDVGPSHRLDQSYVLPISAATAQALRALADRWIKALEGPLRNAACHDIAYTAACRRAHLTHRLAVTGRNHSEWLDALRTAVADAGSPSTRVIATQLLGRSEREMLADRLGELYRAGANPDWGKLYGSGGRLVDVPTYAWDHKTYWHDQAAVARAARHGEAGDRRVVELVARHANVAEDTVTLATTLSELGIDSLGVLQIRSSLARDFSEGSAEIPLPTNPTVADLLSFYRPHPSRSRAAEPDEAVRRIVLKSAGTDPVQVWIHPVGGGIGCYRPLARLLPFRALAIEMARAHPDAQSVEQLASRYLDLLEAGNLLGSPIVLGGWSFGGLVAYEMAVQLGVRGGSVPVVVLIDSLLGALRDVEDAESVMRFVLREQAIHAGGSVSGDSLAPAEIQRLRAVFLSNLGAARIYSPPSSAQPLLLLRAGGSAGHGDEPWRQLAPHLDVRIIDGEHFSILRPPALRKVADAIARSVRDRCGESGPDWHVMREVEP